MALKLLAEEKKVIEIVLWFVNQRRAVSQTQVENKLKKNNMLDCRKDLISPSEDNWPPDDNRSFYVKLKNKLCGWLDQITDSRTEQRVVEREVAVVLNRFTFFVAPMVFSRQRLTYNFQIKVKEMEKMCAYGLALILDKERGATSRLKKCGNGDCGKFNMDLDPKGRPRRFCSQKCKSAADVQSGADRTRRYRERLKVA